MKYKPCCNRTCALGLCKTRESGGCICVCMLKDYEGSLELLLDGTAQKKNGLIIYKPNAEKTPLTGTEKEEVLRELQKTQEALKEYEFKEE